MVIPLFFVLSIAIWFSGCSARIPEKKQPGGSFGIVRTHFLGSLWNQAHARASIISQDGGESFPVSGGALWAFGDTFKGSRSADGTPHFAGGAVSCALALRAPGTGIYPPAFQYLCSSNGVCSPFEFLPAETPTERYRIWPLGGIFLNGHGYLYYSLIEILGNGAWNFRGAGSGLGRAVTNALGSYERLQPGGDWRFPVEPTQVIQSDGWVYLFSVHDFHGKSGASLARVRSERIEDPSAYEFFAGAGPRFSRRKEDAACLVQNVPGQVSVAWNGYLGKFVMASSSDFFRPREIRLLVADALTGPWSAPVARIEVPAERQGRPVGLVYCAYLHPELFRENGRVLNLTYSLDLKNFDANCEMVEIEIQRRN